MAALVFLRLGLSPLDEPDHGRAPFDVVPGNDDPRLGGHQVLVDVGFVVVEAGVERVSVVSTQGWRKRNFLSE